jgi:pyruvate dehydrogenase E1 component alpha subunit
MLMESMSLSSAWKLPVLFVCKNDGWSIATRSASVTGGNINDRARGLGVPAVEVDGLDVSAVWEAACSAIQRARSGRGPTFLNARCVHLEGHFLGFQLLELVRYPLRELPRAAVPLTRSFFQSGGGSLRERMDGLKTVVGTVLSAVRDPRCDPNNDPVIRARAALKSNSVRLHELENRIEKEMGDILTAALAKEQS